MYLKYEVTCLRVFYPQESKNYLNDFFGNDLVFNHNNNLLLIVGKNQTKHWNLIPNSCVALINLMRSLNNKEFKQIGFNVIFNNNNKGRNMVKCDHSLLCFKTL